MINVLNLINKVKTHKDFSINFVWRFLQIFGKQGVVFLIFLISAKYLEPKEFGQLSYSMALIFLLATFCDFGISTVVSKQASESYKTDSEKLKKIMPTMLISVSVFSFFIILTSYAIFSVFFPEQLFYFKYLFPLLFLIPATSLFDGYFRGIKSFKKPSIIVMSSGLVSIIFSFLFILNFGIRGAMLSQVFLYFSLFLLFLFQNKVSFVFDHKIVKNILKYSIVVGLANIGSMLFLKAFQIVAGYAGYSLEVGYFELVSRIMQIAIIMFSIAGQVIAVDNIHMYHDNKIKFVKFYKKSLFLSFIFSLVITILFFLIVPGFVKNFFNKYYTAEFIFIFYLSLLSLPGMLVEAFVSNGFITPLGYAKILTYSIVIASLINFLGMTISIYENAEFKIMLYWFVLISISVNFVKIFWYSSKMKNLS